MKALFWIAAIALVSGCGGSESDDGSGGSGGAAGSGGDAGTLTDGGWPTDGAAGSAGGTGDAGPATVQYDPCATGTCYTARSLGTCGTTTVNDDYSSGLYNVHHFLLMAPAGVTVLLTATRTAGSWSPLLVVHDEQGNTVYDGTDTYATNALSVSPLPAPGSPDTVGVSITATTRMHLGVYLSGAEAVSGGAFTGALPTDAKYTLEANLDCTPPAGLSVRGVKLSARQELWVRYIGEHVVPLVPFPAAERIDKSAYVAWWALKEGVLDTNNPLSYSNCSIPPDKHIGPVELCPNPKNAWQVGISGVQSTYNTLGGVEPLAQQAFPGASIQEVLTGAAVAAGFGASTALAQTITTSTDRLRLSWLLRSGPVGFAAQYSPVYNQCFVNADSWCFGTGWPSSASFAPSQSEAKVAVADLKAIFQTLAP